MGLFQALAEYHCVKREEVKADRIYSPIRDEDYLIKRHSVYILWHCGYWDGPLSGLCHTGYEFAWFADRKDLIDRNAKPGNREVEASMYHLYEIGPDELPLILRRHAAWIELGGSHTTYGCGYGDNQVKPEESRRRWYDEVAKTLPMPDFTCREPFGYFVT